MQTALTQGVSVQQTATLAGVALTHQSLRLRSVSSDAMRTTRCSAGPPQGCCLLSQAHGACDPHELVCALADLAEHETKFLTAGTGPPYQQS